MKTSEFRKLIREEVRKVIADSMSTNLNPLSEAGKVDTAFVLKDIKRFNTGAIDMKTLAINTVKNLGYRTTPANVKNAMEHLSASVDEINEKLPVDIVIVDELHTMLK